LWSILICFVFIHKSVLVYFEQPLSREVWKQTDILFIWYKNLKTLKNSPIFLLQDQINSTLHHGKWPEYVFLFTHAGRSTLYACCAIKTIIQTRLQAEWPKRLQLESWQIKKLFLLHNSRFGLETTQSSIQLKRYKDARAWNWSFPTNSKFTNMWRYTSTSQCALFMTFTGTTPCLYYTCMPDVQNIQRNISRH